MKAVVMAGGEGTRLRPLTVDRPKPMVPVVNRPVMEHIIALLRKHGIDDIIVTLQYLPDIIRDYFGDGKDFGVKIHYSVETSPLGTAGSVREVGDLLTDTFLVISGDALTDMDLTDLIHYHRTSGSTATLALTRVQNPLEFGVVITETSGRISRFLEKPAWSEVFSDTVNTGIYVLEPEALGLMEQGKNYDWSKDIFPRLMSAGRPMYGYVSQDYWCDIGSLDQYMKAQADCLTGRVRVNIPGEQVTPGVWLGRSVRIDPTAKLDAPVLIGDGAVIRRGARIGECSVIGVNTVVDTHADLKRSVTMTQVYAGENARVHGALLAKGVTVNRRADIGEGAVIGDETQVGESAVVKPGVKLWPAKTVEAGARVNTSIVWNNRHARTLFGPAGVGGVGNIEVTPEFAVRLGEAFGSTLSRNDMVLVGRDDHPASIMLKRAVIAGLSSTGVNVLNIESAPLPLVRHAVVAQGGRAGVFVMSAPTVPGGVMIKLLDAHGTDIDTGVERKVETLLVREDTRKVPMGGIGQVSYPVKMLDRYRADFVQYLDVSAIRKRQFRIVLDYSHGAAAQLMPSILGELGCREIALNTAPDPQGLSRTEAEVQQAKEQLIQIVQAVEADFGVMFDGTGERIHLVDNRGRAVGGQQALTLFTQLMMQHHEGGTVAVPVTATSAIERVTGKLGAVERTKTGARALMQAAIKHQPAFCGDDDGGYIFPKFSPGLDGMFAAAQLLQMLSVLGQPLDALLDALPRIDMYAESIPCPREAKGTVMRFLSEATRGKDVQLVDGVKIRRGGSWVALIPDSVKPLLHIFAEPATQAVDLVREYRAVVESAIQTTATEAETASGYAGEVGP